LSPTDLLLKSSAVNRVRDGFFDRTCSGDKLIVSAVVHNVAAARLQIEGPIGVVVDRLLKRGVHDQRVKEWTGCEDALPTVVEVVVDVVVALVVTGVAATDPAEVTDEGI
jgi:hypothetical protein